MYRKAIIVETMKIITLIVLFAASSEVIAKFDRVEFLKAAHDRTTHNVRYDGAYVAIPYPNGDVPANTGVCTDVVIRTYRQLGIDLQERVHEDMKANFNAYPSNRIWGLTTTDRNIDHRRVPNLQVFFRLHGEELPITQNKFDYNAGELVTWMLPGNLPHIGIVSDKHDPISGVPLIIHNIGAGPKLDNILFEYQITGHYRFEPDMS